jgi:hypothetical protein
LLRVTAAAWYDVTELRGKVEQTLLSHSGHSVFMSPCRRTQHNNG